VLKETRKDIILASILESGSADINTVARSMGVSSVTVRRDLDELEKEGKIERIHGGARVLESSFITEPSFSARICQNEELKQIIARKALGLIKENMTIILDSGTTTYALARMIDNSKKICVITNSLNIAIELLTRPNIRVISVGGEVRKNTISCADNLAERFLSTLRADIAFLGTSAVGENGDLFHISVVETGIKTKMKEISNKSYVLGDSSCTPI